MRNDIQVIKEIENVATELLSHCVSDYTMCIWTAIKDDVILDVFECSGIDSGDGFANGDVSLAIGRVLLGRLGDDEWNIYAKD